jgi:hypothetical protein
MHHFKNMISNVMDGNENIQTQWTNMKALLKKKKVKTII